MDMMCWTHASRDPIRHSDDTRTDYLDPIVVSPSVIGCICPCCPSILPERSERQIKEPARHCVQQWERKTYFANISEKAMKSEGTFEMLIFKINAKSKSFTFQLCKK